MSRIAAALLTWTFLIAACPDRERIADEVGGAPKRRIDHARQSVERAGEDVRDRLDKAEEAAEP